MSTPTSTRQILMDAVGAVLNEISARALLQKHQSRIFAHRIFSDESNDNDSARPLHIISIGKMADALVWEFVQLFKLKHVKGVVSCPYNSEVSQVEGISYFRGGHPTPNQQSVEAATAAIDLVSTLSAQDRIVYLISGGGSACFELPDARMSLEDAQLTYEQLVNCGADIREINRIRRELSRVKGGKLAAACPSKNQLTLVVSDVPESDLQFVSSGPTIATDNIPVDLESLESEYSISTKLPTKAIEILSNPLRGSSDNDCIGVDCDSVCIGSNHDAVAAAANYFENRGWQVRIERGYDKSSVCDAARGLTNVLGKLPSEKKSCVIAGGEVSCKVLGDGRGGRNQAFVLECVPIIRDQDIAVLSFGTDGIDGNSPSAGAIADGLTMLQSERLGLNIETFAADSNSFVFFDELGLSIITGPTQCNLCDVRVLIKSPPT